ncbi:MAG: 30S ribosomal protein S7 [Deltaproteobacteria bacterium]|nr:30S ribosomal protein S7 [Deltaproteobacteria bacterium]
MSRKGKTVHRKILPDPKYKDKLVAKLANKIMWGGKKSLAERIVYGAFDIIGSRLGDDPLKVYKQAMDNIKPVLEVVSRRVGGANYQVPIEVRSDRRVTLALRWLITYARERGEKTMKDRLAGEIIEAYHNRGAAIKKRDDVHKMAESNKAFAHFRW